MSQSKIEFSENVSLRELEKASLLSGVRILLAEDSIDCQALMKITLNRMGAVVDVVGDGEEAILRAPQGNYQLVLMDIQMPKVDGYQATRHLRSLGFKAPILALTAHAMKEELKKCLEAGCNDHLTKPIRAAQLLAAILKYAEPSSDRQVH